MDIGIDSAAKRLANQIRLILKKGWSFDLEILLTCVQVNQEKYTQRELPKRIETPNMKNQITTEPRQTSILTGVMVNLGLIKKITSKEKSSLRSLKNENLKNVKLGTEKENKVLQHIGAKFVIYKIGIPQRNPCRNTKPGYEMRLEVQIKNWDKKKNFKGR